MSDAAEQLKKIIDTRDDRVIFNRVHSLRLGGKRGFIATDGRSLLCVADDGAPPDDFEAEKSIAVNQWWSAAVARGFVPVSAAMIERWFAGMGADDKPCPECGGAKRGPCFACGHETDCDYCGGDGTVSEDASAGSIAGRDFNRRLVRRALGVLLMKDVEISIPEERETPTTFRDPSGEWVAFIMGHRSDGGDGPELLRGSKPIVSPAGAAAPGDQSDAK